MRRPRRGDGCAGKRRYASYDEAALVLVDAKIQASLRGLQWRRERRVYWCGICNGHHLTSRPTRSVAS